MKYFSTLFFLLIVFNVFSQNDQEMIEKIFDNTMSSSKTYELLDHLSNEIGGRLSGSLNAERAVEWGRDELKKLVLIRSGFKK